jgi:hypothetical protein
MTEPLTSDDSLNDLLATMGISIWDVEGDPAGPWPMTMAGCPATVSFQLNEPAGSTTVSDESGVLIGTVGYDPNITMPGTGYYHGDETLDTYIDVDNDNALMCMMSPRALTLEARIYPTEVDSDFGDDGIVQACTSDWDCDAGGTVLCSCGRDTDTDRSNRCPGDTGGCDLKPGYYYGCTYNYSSSCPVGEVCCPNPGEGCWNNSGFCSVSDENATFSRIFHKHRNLMVTVIHTDYRGDSRPDRANKASIEVKYFVDNNASRHSCPYPSLWPDDTWVGTSAKWHQISSGIDEWPLVNNHWYKVRVVFDSDDPIQPVYIFLDDQGEDGLDSPNPTPGDPTSNPEYEQWEGYVNATKSIQDSSSCRWGAKPGDFIDTENQPSFIGTPRPPGSGIHAASHIFDGDIDWVTWKPVADYSDVMFSGSSVLSGGSQFGSTSVNKPYDYSEDLGMSVIRGYKGHSSPVFSGSGNPKKSGTAPDTVNNSSSEVFTASSSGGLSDSGVSFIRVCEGCHGYESLHNIQVDSEPDGQINVGNELPGYGHIGHNDDCWGCHGFLQANAPGTGPVVPTIISFDISVITEGTDTAITLTGSGFTNLIYGFELTSIVRVRAADGSMLELTPDAISEDLLTVTIPGTVPIGNYDLRAFKGNTESNPVIISVKPAVIITNVDCSKKRELLTVTGSGFGTKVEGTEAYINLEVNGAITEIISWADTRIKASVSRCLNGATVTVNALYGSATSSAGKPPKPCKGKGCNK